MAILVFIATSAELFTHVGEFERKSPGLYYCVRLARGESMKLATGENFDELDGQLTLLAESDTTAHEDKTVGLIRYFAARDDDIYPFPASYTVEVRVSNSQLNELLAAARYGRVPSHISVDIEGMEYDWQPDGSGKKWDNKTAPHLKIASVRFTIPLVASAADGNSERESGEEFMPPTRAQFAQLSERLDRLTSETKTGLRALLWAVIVIGALVFFL